jgi:hypothetical protein
MTARPLFLYHLKKITMVNNLLENRAKSQPIMATEGGRKPDDWDRARQLWGLKGWIRAPYCRIKVRKNSAVSV